MTATMIPAAAVPDPSLLIARYRRVLEAADEVPFLFLVRRRPGRLHWFGRTLRTRVLLRFFIRWHVASTVSELRRAALARAAAEPCEECYAAVAERLERFEKSLRGVRLRQALVVSLVSVFLVAFLLARGAPQWDPTLSNLFSQDGGASQKIGMRDAADPLANMTGAMLTLNPREVGSALKSFACSGKSTSGCSAHRALISAVTSFILLGVAAWLVALFPLAAFRLKRTLFNLDADDDIGRRVRAQPARQHLSAAEGIYRLEADLFRTLGHRRYRELPLDLVGQGCILVAPLWLAVMTAIYCAYGIRYVVRDGAGPGATTAILTCALLSVTLAIFPVARLASLRWAQRMRRAAAAATPSPAIPGATLRRRLLAHLVDTVPVVTLGVLLLRDGRPFFQGETGRLVTVFAICPLALGVLHGAFVVRGGRTLGKAVLGLRVVGGDGRAVSRGRLLVREIVLKGSLLGVPWLLLPELWRPLDVSLFWFVATVSWSLAGAAYACSAWNLRRSPLHDLLLDTTVARELRQPHGAAAAVAPVAAGA